MTRVSRALVAVTLTSALWAGCDDGPTTTQSAGLGLPGAPAGAAKPAAGGATNVTKRLPPVSYSDDDFLESDRNRDPFRAHLATRGRAQVADVSQRRVVMPTTAIESMRLVAIITGTERPRAMILDPTDVGHVVERGMFIGSPQVVQATGNVAMTLNWRVDRIRENEVVLSRQDPTDPTRPPLSRVMPLHEEIAQR